MKEFLIYGLVDPRDDQIMYIGKSQSGLTRPHSHRNQSKLSVDSSPKGNWIRELIGIGLDYGVEILERCSISTELCEAEKRWIAQGRFVGWPLLNVAAGGIGGAFPCKDETREKISRAKLGKPRPDMVGKRPVVADRNIGAKQTPEFIEKRIAPLRGRKGKCASDETKAKMAAAHTGKTHSSETRALMQMRQLARREAERAGRPAIRINLLGGST